MKRIFLALTLMGTLSGFAGAARADEKVTISGVHNCCGKCAAGINKALGSVAGVTSTLAGDKVSLSAAKTEDLQKAVDALTGAGYAGSSDNAAVKVNLGAAPDEKVTSLTITGTHMCCGGCVRPAEKAIKSVPGVKSHTLAVGVESFKVEGEFNAKALMEALAKAGYTGKVTK